LEIGAATAGAKPAELAALGRFGDCYGIAFQHADDRDDSEHAAFAAEARRRIHELVTEAAACLDEFDDKAAPLRALAWKLDPSAVAGR
jgi:geranylgeranyl pyrophosphate synthase